MLTTHPPEKLDESQQHVLRLDPQRHARVVGAPGTGKTTMLVKSALRFLEHGGWADDELFVIAPTRRVASRLREQIDLGMSRAHSGRCARTPTSFAQRLLQRQVERQGLSTPRLMTGLREDQLLVELLKEHPEFRFGLSQDDEVSLPVRNELRDLWRVIDEYAVHPGELAQQLATGGSDEGLFQRAEGKGTSLRGRLVEALRFIEIATKRRLLQHPDEFSASAMVRAATELVLEGEHFDVPKLLILDDAADVGEGSARLLAACAAQGCSIWAFGTSDLATGAYSGERARLLEGVTAELVRAAPADRAAAIRRDPGLAATPVDSEEQVVVLQTVYRHDDTLRSYVAELGRRAGGSDESRRARSASGEAAPAPTRARRTIVSSDSAMLGVTSNLLRSLALGTSESPPISWSDMAVICRRRSEVERIARALAAREVPTSVSAGGTELRDASIVRELIQITRHALGIAALQQGEVFDLLQGVIGGCSPIAMKRLRAAVRIEHMRRCARDGDDPAPLGDLIVDAATHRRPELLVESAEGRALQRLGSTIDAACRVASSGGSPREVMWEVWSRTGLAERWQQEALAAEGSRADEANRNLDAVVALFFTLQRHEEQRDQRSVAEMFDDVLTQRVAEDTVESEMQRDVVTITTPHAVIGQSFAAVVVLDLQDSRWPNLRSRGSLLGANVLERWLRGGEASIAHRRETLQDELRLLVSAASRARNELLLVAVRNEQSHESVFWHYGELERVALPSAQVTLRGVCADMRRRLTLNPEDRVARDTLALLASEGVPGAHPDEWFGVLPPSTVEPLVDLNDATHEPVHVSPSQIERAEACPLDWFIHQLGAAKTTPSMQVGTLVHDAFEAGPASASELASRVRQHWGELEFEATWQDAQWWQLVQDMTDGLAEYFAHAEHAEFNVIGSESQFHVTLENAQLQGVADRIEARIDDEGMHVRIVDLKTGATKPSAAEMAEHAQLLAYQLGVMKGAFSDAMQSAWPAGGAIPDGAELLFVHPKARGKRPFVRQGQAALDEAAADAFIERVEAAARIMAGSQFTAEIEHHCTKPFAGGACEMHIVGEVSAA